MFETLLFIGLDVPGWSWVFTASRGDAVAVFGGTDGRRTATRFSPISGGISRGLDACLARKGPHVCDVTTPAVISGVTEEYPVSHIL